MRPTKKASERRPKVNLTLDPGLVDWLAKESQRTKVAVSRIVERATEQFRARGGWK